MRLLVEMLKSNDLRLLTVPYDTDYSLEKLVEVFDKIMQEYQELKGNKKYEKELRDVQADLYELHKINACWFSIECIEFMRLDLAQDIIDLLKLKLNGIQIDLSDTKKAKSDLEALAKSIETSMMIANVNEAKNKIKHEDQSWEDMQVRIHLSLGVSVDYDCTVAKFIAYEKSEERLIEAQKKLKAKKDGK